MLLSMFIRVICGEISFALLRCQMLLKKESHLYAFLYMKCPRCHHGDMFTNNNPYALSKMSDMPLSCPVCGQPYVLEPGFYWGAMYMSYALTLLFSAINVALIWLLFGFHLYLVVFGNAALLLLMFPLFFRYSRVLWLQLNVPFNSEAFEEAEHR